MAAPLTPSRLQMAAHYFTNYAVVLPDGVAFDDALEPGFWAHLGDKLRQHDTIRVIPEDGAYFAELLVIAAGRGFVKVKSLRFVELTDEEIDEAEVPEGIVVKWRGPHAKWCVERSKDGVRLKEGIVEKVDAHREAAGYKLAA